MRGREIIEATERYYDLAPGSLKTTDRHRAISWPRQMAMYAIRVELDWSFLRIARAFGLRDHATAMHGCRAFAARLMKNPEKYAGDLFEIMGLAQKDVAA